MQIPRIGREIPRAIWASRNNSDRQTKPLIRQSIANRSISGSSTWNLNHPCHVLLPLMRGIMAQLCIPWHRKPCWWHVIEIDLVQATTIAKLCMKIWTPWSHLEVTSGQALQGTSFLCFTRSSSLPVSYDSLPGKKTLWVLNLGPVKWINDKYWYMILLMLQKSGQKITTWHVFEAL